MACIEPLQQRVRDYAAGQEELSLKERWYLQSISTLGSAIRFHYSGDATSNNSRDSVMFDNIQWINHQKSNAKVLVFAHNAHIEKQEGLRKTANLPRLGWLLARHYGNRYMTIATEVECGQLWAGGNNTVRVAQARDKLGCIICRSVCQSSGLLLLHTAPLKEFFNKEHSTTFGGSSRVRHRSKASFYYSVKNYAKAYDAIFWLRDSSPKFPTPEHAYNLIAGFKKQSHPAFFAADSLHVSLELTSETLGGNGS